MDDAAAVQQRREAEAAIRGRPWPMPCMILELERALRGIPARPFFGRSAARGWTACAAPAAPERLREGAVLATAGVSCMAIGAASAARRRFLLRGRDGPAVDEEALALQLLVRQEARRCFSSEGDLPRCGGARPCCPCGEASARVAAAACPGLRCAPAGRCTECLTAAGLAKTQCAKLRRRSSFVEASIDLLSCVGGPCVRCDSAAKVSRPEDTWNSSTTSKWTSELDKRTAKDMENDSDSDDSGILVEEVTAAPSDDEGVLVEEVAASTPRTTTSSPTRPWSMKTPRTTTPSSSRT